MKKRIFSLVLALMLCLSLAPMAALAASGEATVEPAEPTGEIAEETLALEGASGETTEGDTTATDEPSVHSVGESGLPQEGDASDAVSYYDPTEVGEGRNKTCPHYTVVENTTTTWSDSWYVVQDNVTIDGTVTIPEGNAVHLILCDGASLTVNGCMSGGTAGVSLTIYGQGNGTGMLTVNGAQGQEYVCGIEVNGDLTINGGTVNATGGSATATGSSAYSYGIYATSVTVNGGTVNATGGSATATGSSAYSYGIYATSVTATGGSVTATGSSATGTSLAESCGIHASQLTTNGQITARGGDATATAAEGGNAHSEGIYVDKIIASGGTVTATAGNATATGGRAYSKGVGTAGVTVSDGAALEATGGAVRASYEGASYGIYVYCYNNNESGVITVNGTVNATSGAATASYLATSYGVYAENEIVNEGEIAAVGDGASATDHARSYGICAENEIVNKGEITANGGVATVGESDDGNSYGIYVGDDFTVNGGTVTATTAGTPGEDYDICVYYDFALDGGTVKSSRDGGAVRVSAEPLEVSGGTMKLAEGSLLYAAEVSNGVALGDLLSDGCAYNKIKCVSTYRYNGSWERDYSYDYAETDVGFVMLDGLAKLDKGYSSGEDEINYVLTETWYEYCVMPCTHSTTEGVCAYCGKDLTPEPTATPAPTAVPTATPTPTAKPQAPNTGDEANVVLWFVLATVSVFGVAVVGRKKVK